VLVNGVLATIVNERWAEIDDLPFTAKLLLINRLSKTMGVDLANMRDRMYHFPNPSTPEQPAAQEWEAQGTIIGSHRRGLVAEQ
jgi:hypothetical protein